MHVCPNCGYSDSELIKDNPKLPIDHLYLGQNKLIPDEIISKISEWKDKVKKYDNWMADDKWVLTIEKAKKWDSLDENLKTNTYLLKCDEWKEKAQKWDNHLCVNNSGNAPEYVEYVKKLEEKTKKWDSINSDTVKKADKYDEIVKLVKSLGMLNLYALSKKIEEMLR